MTISTTRIAFIAKKIGMSQVFNADGSCEAVTLLEVPANYVVGYRSTQKDGYSAVLLAGGGKVKHVNKPQKKLYETVVKEPQVKICEVRIDGLDTVGANEFAIGEYLVGRKIDVTATTRGKGFAGGMKRHNFRGLEASHGVSVSHRSHGSTGNRQDPGKVFKNKKMAGHMGDVRNTTQNLRVHSVDAENNLLIVSGCVSGAIGGVVFVQDSVKSRSKTVTHFNGVDVKGVAVKAVTEEVVATN